MIESLIDYSDSNLILPSVQLRSKNPEKLIYWYEHKLMFKRDAVAEGFGWLPLKGFCQNILIKESVDFFDDSDDGFQGEKISLCLVVNEPTYKAAFDLSLENKRDKQNGNAIILQDPDGRLIKVLPSQSGSLPKATGVSLWIYLFDKLEMINYVYLNRSGDLSQIVRKITVPWSDCTKQVNTYTKKGFIIKSETRKKISLNRMKEITDQFSDFLKMLQDGQNSEKTLGLGGSSYNIWLSTEACGQKQASFTTFTNVVSQEVEKLMLELIDESPAKTILAYFRQLTNYFNTNT